MSEAKAPYKIEGRPATIFHVAKNKDNPYVMLDRRPLENKKLSFKAKGILAYLMSRPDGWEVSVSDLVKRGADGKASVRAGLKELRDAGHMRYMVSRQQGRITGWIIEVYELPLTENLTDENPTDEIIDEGDTPQVGVTTMRLSVSGGSPESDFQEVENQQVENRTQVLSTLSSKKSSIKNNTHTEKPDFVNLTVVEAMSIPEIKIFTQATGLHPGAGQLETIWQTIRDMRAAGKPVTAERLRPFYLAWCEPGFNAHSLNWLTDWAVSGKIPERSAHRKPQSAKPEPEYRTL